VFKKLVVGRYLNFRDPKPKLTYVDGEFLAQPRVALTVEQSAKEKVDVQKRDSKGDLVKLPDHSIKLVTQKQRVSDILAGENEEKAHRNFQWLGYYPGAVSEVTLDNLPVLSGPFSGCWMMVYRKDGRVHVGHVGTDINRPEKTRAAKEAWVGFANPNRFDVLRGFNPVRAWAEDSPERISGDGTPVMIWGLVTEDQLYSIYLRQGGLEPTRYRIAGVKQVEPTYMTALAEI